MWTGMDPVSVSDFILICDLLSYAFNYFLALLRLDCGWPAPRHVFSVRPPRKAKSFTATNGNSSCLPR